MPTITKFEKLKKYINKQPIGSIIRRKDLVKEMQETRKDDVTTTDSYRALLTKVGILEETKTLGQYLLKDHIGRSLTLNYLKKLAGTKEQMLNKNVDWLKKIFT